MENKLDSQHQGCIQLTFMGLTIREHNHCQDSTMSSIKVERKKKQKENLQSDTNNMTLQRSFLFKDSWVGGGAFTQKTDLNGSFRITTKTRKPVTKSFLNSRDLSDQAKHARIRQNFISPGLIYHLIKGRNLVDIEELCDYIKEMYQHYRSEETTWQLLTRLDGALTRLMRMLSEIFCVEFLNENDLTKNNIECASCQKRIERTGLRLTFCLHNFHHTCLEPAEEYGRICPICIDECPLCFEKFTPKNKTRTLSCGHNYHRFCWTVVGWGKHDDKCPYCRDPVTEKF